jgi:hypothetical protein
VDDQTDHLDHVYSFYYDLTGSGEEDMFSPQTCGGLGNTSPELELAFTIEELDYALQSIIGA